MNIESIALVIALASVIFAVAYSAYDLTHQK